MWRFLHGYHNVDSETGSAIVWYDYTHGAQPDGYITDTECPIRSEPARTSVRCA
eukprot:COSAG02_NODE_12626_length_1517_cov_4.714109_1_plen_53_part_10